MHPVLILGIPVQILISLLKATMTGEEYCDHFDNNTIDSCYFLSCDLHINNACVTISLLIIYTLAKNTMFLFCYL